MILNVNFIMQINLIPRLASIFALAIVLITVVASCNSKKTDNVTKAAEKQQVLIDKKEPTADKKTILFFGNSLTAGYGLDPEDSFPSRIEDIVDSLNMPYSVVNAGLSGETTSGGLNRIDWVLSQKVDVFVLELGANDMLRGLPVAETKKNLKAIMDRVKAKYPSAKIVLAEMMAAPNMGTDYRSKFQQLYTDLAKSESVLLMPFFLREVADKPEFILPDGKHPNTEGQKIVAATVWNYLKDIL